MENDISLDSISAILSHFTNRRWFAQKDEHVEFKVIRNTLIYATENWKVYGILFDAKGRETIRYFVPLIISNGPLHDIPHTFKIGDTIVGEADLGGYYLHALMNTSNYDVRVDLPEIEVSTFKLLGGGNTTNINVVINNEMVLKTYRIVDRYNPEPEYLAALSQKTDSIPHLEGQVYFGGELVNIATKYIPQSIIASRVFGEALNSYLENGNLDQTRELAFLLGQTTAKFHDAISSVPEFKEEDIKNEDIECWRKSFVEHLSLLPSDIPKDTLLSIFNESLKKSRKKMRTHMDYHLEQVLYSRDLGKFFIIDLEGEPQRKGPERKLKYPPERDVATMIRSFDYLCKMHPDYRKMNEEMNAWARYAIRRFVAGYESVRNLNKEGLISWVVEKAVLEYLYETSFRKEYVYIPASALKELADGRYPWAGDEMKLVIVVRKDLKMGKGKLAVEVAHASVRAALESPQNYVKKWISEGERKVVVWAESLEHLHELASRARSEGLPVFVISDAGRTQVPSSTITCIAIGPSPEWKVDKITGNLKLIS